MAVIYRTPGKVSGKIAEALGLICTSFAMLEWNVDRTIWALTGNNRKKGRHLTLHLLNKGRLKRLRQEAINHFGANHRHAKKYKQIADEIQKAVEIRNLYVHGIWAKGKAKGTRRQQFVLSYFSNPRGDAEHVDLPTLLAFIKLIRLRAIELEIASVRLIGVALP